MNQFERPITTANKAYQDNGGNFNLAVEEALKELQLQHKIENKHIKNELLQRMTLDNFRKSARTRNWIVYTKYHIKREFSKR